VSVSVDLGGKVALVTGASRGIGRACALMLARAGADVAVHFEKRSDAAASVVSEARSLGVRAEAFASDHRREDTEASLARQVEERLGRIDILVLNAGIWKRAPIDRISGAELDEMLAVNLRAPMLLTRAAVHGLIARRDGGAIVFISSTAGQRGEAFHSHYAATKGALISLTKSLATELAPQRIRVNCVAPGWVKTDMTRDALGGSQGEAIKSAIPAGDAGRPEDIAHAVLFLVSPWAEFITGEILNVNGGAVLCG
jgi:3-oxoacyl-[acyl-carrier protein] reductase